MSKTLERIRSHSARRKRRREISQSYWAQEQDLVDSSIDLDTRLALVSEYGDFSLAYSTAVQPRLEYHGDYRGYIAYRRRWGITFALGDVVADPAYRQQLVREFIGQHPRLMFCQVSRPLAELLHEDGFRINEMGIDSTIDLPTFSFAGKQKEWLRYASNWSQRRDFHVMESDFDTVHPRTVEAISEAWRKTRTVKRKEVRFLNRPIVLQDEANVRKFFYLGPDGDVLAFVFLDPLFRNGEIIGYVTSIKRRHPEAPIYSEQAIMKHAIDTLQAEGHAELKLGLSPLAWLEDDEFRPDWMTRRLFHHAFGANWVNQHFYHLAGHADYKRRFRGREEKLYLASRSRFSPMLLLALIGLCGVA